MSTTLLKAYIRRTVNEKAKGYSGTRKERLAGAFVDAERGTDTGWWSDLIYTQDVVRMARRYRKAIREVVEAYLDETGYWRDRQVDPRGYGAQDGLTFGEVIMATFATPGAEQHHDRLEEALTWGIRFAIEWLVHEVASDMGIDF